MKGIQVQTVPANERAPLEAVTWDEGWNSETLELAYQDALKLQPLCSEWADALDTKTVAVFGVGSAILGLVPVFRELPITSVTFVVWGLAFASWGAATWHLHRAYTPSWFRVGTNPNTLLRRDWLSLSPTFFRLYHMRAMGEAFDRNRAAILRKGESLTQGIGWTAVGVGLLALAFVLSRV
jgi:hypothetical protein